MNIKDYQNGTRRTDRESYDEVKLTENQKRILHHSIGIAGESGELVDAVKKHIFYGHELDVVNLKEEAGDLLWYISNLLYSIDSSLEEVMEMNHEKLKKRYAKGFSEKEAKDRADKA